MTTVLLTGSTGFLGTETALQLIRTTDAKIYALVRAENTEEAMHRLKSQWHDEKDLIHALDTRITPVIGDFVKADLGLSEEDRNTICADTEYVIHIGADTSLQKEEEHLLAVNSTGTLNVLKLAEAMPALKRFVYVSTAYVSGTRDGLIMEEDHHTEEFCSFYEKSKAMAEEMIYTSSLPYIIVRPGMIIGRSYDGKAKNFNTIYYVLRQLLIGKMKVIPASKNLKLNLVPVDYVCSALLKAAFLPEAEGKTYHLTCPENMQPSAGELVQYVKEWAEKNLSLKLNGLTFLSSSLMQKAGLSYNHKAEKKKGALSNMLALAPYFYGKQKFDRTNADTLGTYAYDWKEYADVLLSYACRRNFMRQSGNSVFEQAEIRRESTHYPITYHDITADAIIPVSGAEVNERIHQVLDALWAWGIRKGDKVALTGINCIDYMTIDQAIGLLGAVSVPIYYTTPMEEAQLLLEKSGAKWFFVGDMRIMKHIEELQADVQVVAFCRGLETESAKPMRWEEFLAKTEGPAPKQYADPDALATIRYTSGTTGEPKGTMFSYGQLAWMGEVLTNLLGWKDRNHEMRYLSFLPQSHVVEGILASYAPYYMLAHVDFYYLNDFGALVDTLPKVRPTVFFSVPRFYEKLWDQLCANPFGQKYLAMEDGPAKAALGVVLKKIILKKSGLDACGQLIVGSAPISEALLLNFRKLGIEIHNAYGQTEAPLITINRAGDNIIPTIGTPLPETEVTIAEDGELIVTGPQVTLGYYGLQTDSIQNAVLKTGDLGSIDTYGHITLHGRKKEMIITAYGKNISTPKIEELLKNIRGVSEAVLIGENRPYCTALLWTEGETEDLDQAIAKMNGELSHPEQIRRFTVIDTPLSIQKGELTPNLKVKRRNVEEHYQEEIERMYQ